MKRGHHPSSAVRDASFPVVANGAQPIRQWAAHDRPRERLITHGAAALSDAELLAVLLGNGSVGRDGVGTGRALLLGAASLGRLLADPDGIPRVGGVGPVKRARLAATVELARRA